MLAGPAVAAGVALLLVSRHGPYLSTDGLHYVGTARNLLDGEWAAPPGSTALGNFPPLFSLVLAAVGLLGPDPLTVAQYLNPVVGALVVLVVGLLVRRAGGSVWQAAGAQLLVATGVDFLAFSASALSEPLFVLLVLLTVWAQWDRRIAVAALCAGAACLTRYLGVAVVAAGAAWLVLAPAFSGRLRRDTAVDVQRSSGGWREAGVFAGLALAPLVAWAVGVAAAGVGGARKAAVHLPDGDYFVRGLRSASTWITTDEVAWPARGVIAAAVVAALTALVLRSRSRGPQGVLGLVGLVAVAYLGVLVVQRSLFEVTGRLDARFLLVVHVLAALAVAAAAARHRAVTVVIWVLVAAHVPSAVDWIADGADTNRPTTYDGFAARVWRDSAVLDALPRGAEVTSNLPDVVYFHTGRVAKKLAAPTDFSTGEPDPDHQRLLAATRGYVAFFTMTVGGGATNQPPPDPTWVEVARDATGVLYKTPT